MGSCLGRTPPKCREKLYVYKALFPYTSITPQQLSAKKGETFDLMQKVSDQWYLVRSRKTGKSGLIPSEFLGRVDTHEMQSYYHGYMNKYDANHRIMESANNKPGTFLVRADDLRRSKYFLVVRDESSIKQYKISYKDDGFYLPHAIPTFPSIQDLVKFYSQRKDGLNVKLQRPASAGRKRPAIPLSSAFNTE